MTIARSLIVDSARAGYYSCTSRCVRRAFLCGDGYEHRRAWIKERLIKLTSLFAIDVCSHAVMSNHLHTQLYVNPNRARAWSSEDVVRRWLTIYPGQQPDSLQFEEAIAELASDTELVATWRFRLASLSWFHKALKETIARRANREDGCTGTFWEGRFHCAEVVDTAGRLSCAIYQDLNVIRAGMAKTPEASDYTSAQDRIAVRQAHASQSRPGRSDSGEFRSPHVQRLRRGRTARTRHGEDGIWLKPIMSHKGDDRDGFLDVPIDRYLALLDQVGRMIRTGKRGVIPSSLAPILERLEIDADTWLDSLMHKTQRIVGTAIGLAKNLEKVARRRGQVHVRSSLRLQA